MVLVTGISLGLIFELSWNFIPDLHGKRTLKVLQSLTEQVLIEVLPHLAGEGGTDMSSAFAEFPVQCPRCIMVTGFREGDSSIEN